MAGMTFTQDPGSLPRVVITHLCLLPILLTSTITLAIIAYEMLLKLQELLLRDLRISKISL